MAKAIMGTGAINGIREAIMMITRSSPKILPKSLMDSESGLEKWEIISMGKNSQASHQAGPANVFK